MASKINYDSDAVANGDVEISEDNPEGKFVRLTNYGNQEISLSAWTLTRKAGEMETTHKFHRMTRLESKGSVTIWPADVEGVTHNPPTTVVMKRQKKWFSSDHIVTILRNNKGVEMAKRETRVRLDGQ